MNIQPCGSDESIAYCDVKYVSKVEPAQLDFSLAQAIQQIKKNNTNISQK
jgi:hypothetical protein